MFYLVLVALVMLFGGATFLDGALREKPLIFLAFWAACTWITLAAVLLALFDMLLVRAAHRRARRHLEQEILGETARKDKPDDDAP